MLNKINLHYFLISFCVGLFFVYVTKPKSIVVHKFPSPNNTSSTQYRDGANNCYKFDYEEVTCADGALPQPIMEGFQKKA